MVNKEKRKEIRVQLTDENIQWNYLDNPFELKTSPILDISKNGVFIESKDMPNKDQVINLCFKLPLDLGLLPLKGKVTWRRWAATKKSKLPIGFGVSIIHDNTKFEKIFDSLVIFLRNKQIIKVSKQILEVFFGVKTPPSAPLDKGPIA